MDIGLFFATKGSGGIIALTAISITLTSYAALIWWIIRGGREEEEEKPSWERMGWPYKK